MRLWVMHNSELYINPELIEDVHVSGSEADASVIIRMASGEEHLWKRFANRNTTLPRRNLQAAEKELASLVRGLRLSITRPEFHGRPNDGLASDQRTYADLRWPGKAGSRESGFQ
jgi:hypothetical protein